MRTLLIVFIAIDFSFVFFHLSTIIYDKNAKLSSLLLLDTQFGLAETFQFSKYVFGLILIGTYVLKHKWAGFGALFLVFMILLIDDFFQLHNRIASDITDFLELCNLWVTKGINLGYMIYILGIGAIISIIILIGYLKTTDYKRNYYNQIIVLLFLFLCYGFLMDAINHIVTYNYGQNELLTVIEEGGEMITLSFLVCYICGIGPCIKGA